MSTTYAIANANHNEVTDVFSFDIMSGEDKIVTVAISYDELGKQSVNLTGMPWAGDHDAQTVNHLRIVSEAISVLHEATSEDDSIPLIDAAYRGASFSL